MQLRPFVSRFIACATATLALLAAPASSSAADGHRLEQIRSSQVLRVCVWPDYYAITYLNPKTQEYSGIDIDNARALGKALGARVDFVSSSFATLVDDVNNERCDIAMFAIGITPARQKVLRFTPPHLASDVYGITTLSNRRIRSWSDIDKSGTVVVVAQGTLHEPIMKERLRNAELQVVSTPHAREDEVRSGRADVFMTDYPYSQRMLKDNDWAKLVSPDQTFHITPYAWAMKPGDDAFFEQVNQFLAEIKRDGRLKAHATRHGLQAIVVP